MWILWWSLAFAFCFSQEDVHPSYVQAGDRVEEQFRAYSMRLGVFFNSLHDLVERNAPALLPGLQDAPSEQTAYGYQWLPRITDAAESSSDQVSSFSYSWPATQTYIDGEYIKLDSAEGRLKEVMDDERPAASLLLSDLIAEYRSLRSNQRTIDQYIGYNRFWQQAIAADRPRFDQLTELYYLMKTAQPDIAQAIRQALGKPQTPEFVKIFRPSDQNVIVRVPLYTDIDDDAFLQQVRRTIEEFWQAIDASTSYSVELDLRKIPLDTLYRGVPLPQAGDQLSLREHTSRFPRDGAVLTTGAETTYGFVGRYVALGPGNLSRRTLAHEFGHVLGFRDGYIRGYRDLQDSGFEILELTSAFDDIMTSPREGHVQATHFRLIIDSVQQR